MKKKCPVCNNEYQKIGMVNHIRGRAKSELWNLCIGESKSRKHLDYVMSNTEKVDIKWFKLNIVENFKTE